jgi:hypothetical protein
MASFTCTLSILYIISLNQLSFQASLKTYLYLGSLTIGPSMCSLLQPPSTAPQTLRRMSAFHEHPAVEDELLLEPSQATLSRTLPAKDSKLCAKGSQTRHHKNQAALDTLVLPTATTTTTSVFTQSSRGESFVVDGVISGITESTVMPGTLNSLRDPPLSPSSTSKETQQQVNNPSLFERMKMTFSSTDGSTRPKISAPIDVVHVARPQPSTVKSPQQPAKIPLLPFAIQPASMLASRFEQPARSAHICKALSSHPVRTQSPRVVFSLPEECSIPIKQELQNTFIQEKRGWESNLSPISAWKTSYEREHRELLGLRMELAQFQEKEKYQRKRDIFLDNEILHLRQELINAYAEVRAQKLWAQEEHTIASRLARENAAMQDVLNFVNEYHEAKTRDLLLQNDTLRLIVAGHRSHPPPVSNSRK